MNHKPGSKVDYINISQILGNKLIEIIENKSYEKVLEEELFKPLNINILNAVDKTYYKLKYYNQINQFEINTNNYIFLKHKDIYKIYYNLKNEKIISKKLFNKMKQLKDYEGINYYFSYNYCDSFYFNRNIKIYDFKNINLQILFFTKFSGYELIKNEESINIYQEIIKQIPSFYLKYNNPKLEKLNKKNIYSLLDITNSKERLYFMGPTKYILAYSYTFKQAKPYLLKDNDIYVGVLILNMDKKIMNM